MAMLFDPVILWQVILMFLFSLFSFFYLTKIFVDLKKIENTGNKEKIDQYWDDHLNIAIITTLFFTGSTLLLISIIGYCILF